MAQVVAKSREGTEETAGSGVAAPPRRRRNTRTREALRAAALQLFASQGYSATTISEIATAAGVTERAFFLHYPSKEDVLFNVDQDDVALFKLCVIEEPHRGDIFSTLEGAILTWNRALMSNEEGRHQMAQLLISAAQSSATLRGKQLDYSETLARSAAEALASRRQDEHATRADQTVSETAIRLLYLAIVDWTEGRPGDLRALIRTRFAELRQEMAATTPPADIRRPA